MTTLTASQAAYYARQQLRMDPASPDGQCRARACRWPATRYVRWDDYASATTGGGEPATAYTRVCGECEDLMRERPGFVSSEALNAAPADAQATPTAPEVDDQGDETPVRWCSAPRDLGGDGPCIVPDPCPWGECNIRSLMH